MARLKIDYGIDLGTTNSAICRMEKGTPVIKKIQVSDDTMSSCVYFTPAGGTHVGKRAYTSMKRDKSTATKTWSLDATNAYVEFKRTMGTDTIYHSSNMEKRGLKSDYTSEELSAEVLKALKSYITDENFSSVVITVPAKFTIPQIDATTRAAKLAGFERCELLQEPLAACYAYGLSSDQKNGYWLVFDFGGGTFDAALVKVEDGIISVVDTEGDSYLGGKNLDYAIVDEIIIPYIRQNFCIDGILADSGKKKVLRDAMKTKAEDLKNNLSFNDQDEIESSLGEFGCDDNGTELDLYITVSQEEVFNVMHPIFQKAVDICKALLSRNSLTGSELNKLILVGGPTHSPLVRQMLKEQITPNVDTSIDPMTAVAVGAALYASTKDANPPKEEDIQIGTVRLNVGYEATSVEASEWISVQLDKAATGPNCPAKVYVQLVNAQKTWSSGKIEVNEIGNVIEANLQEGKANSFTIETYDELGNSLECFPNEITILQGTKPPKAPLPMHIGIEVWNEERKKLVFEPIEGLEKNKPLSATGTLNGLKTTNQIRVGNASDRIVVPIYQATEYDKERPMSSKIFNYAGEVIIDGTEDDLITCIPCGATVDFTFHVDESEHMIVDAYFPVQDITISKDFNVQPIVGTIANKQVKEFQQEAQRILNDLAKDGVDVSDLQIKLNESNKEVENNTEFAQILEHLKEVMREIEKRDIESEYIRIENELRSVFEMTERHNKKYGDTQTTKELEQLRVIVNEAIAKKDVKMAKADLDQVYGLDFRLAGHEYFIVWIIGWQRNFNTHSWKDRNRAQQLINQAIPIIQNNPTAEKLQPYVQQLISLLPENEIPEGAGGRVKRG